MSGRQGQGQVSPNALMRNPFGSFCCPAAAPTPPLISSLPFPQGAYLKRLAPLKSLCSFEGDHPTRLSLV